MRCVRCGREAGYNRAVIDRFSGAQIGRLCMNCEREEFGNSFTYSTSSESHQCVFCKRDGQILFPRYLPEADRSGGDVVVTSSIERTGSVPCLCDEHFHEITEEEREKRLVKS